MLNGVRDRLKSWWGRSDSERGGPPLFRSQPGVEPEKPESLADSAADPTGIVQHPDVYPFAAYLARMYDCRTVIDLGCGRATELVPLAGEFQLVGVDQAQVLEEPRRRLPLGNWIEWDLERDAPIPLPDAREGSAVVCADVIGHLRDPLPLLKNLRWILDGAPFALLSIPEPDFARRCDRIDSADDPSKTGDWNLVELERLLASVGLRVPFIGYTASHDNGSPKGTIVALLESPTGPIPPRGPAPEGFRVVALMPVYNEADVVEHSIAALVSEGIEVYVIDNWSTDETSSIAERLVGRGVIGVERFPRERPTARMEWSLILRRIEELSVSLDADWVVHVDADERRRSPWPGVGLRDALFYVDQCGFNCVDHTVLVFHPTADVFVGGDVEDEFCFFEFGQRPGHFMQRKAWKNTGARPVHAESGGHDTTFPGRRVYPFKFLLKHYPIRSQAHGERKVFRERIERFDPREREAGWHTHYDLLAEEPRFARDAAKLLRFSTNQFHREFLVERLSGIGVSRLVT